MGCFGHEVLVTAPPVRVAMVTEGTYPYTTGGVSTWCDQLVQGIDVSFDLVALTGTGTEDLRWELPASVRSVQQVGVWARCEPTRTRRKHRRALRDVTTRMWDAVIAPYDGRTGEFDAAIADWLELARDTSVSALLTHEGSLGGLLDAWNQHAGDLPPLSVAGAARACGLVDRTLALADTRLADDIDVVHATASGPTSLVAMAHEARTGARWLLTEHGVQLRERYLAAADESSWSVRRAVTSFHRHLAGLACRRADRLLPVTEFNARWERRLGAPASAIRVIHNGVEVDRYPVIEREPEVPTTAFVGRIDPLKDLATLIRAHALVRQRVPDARLRLFGPLNDANREYAASLEQVVDEMGVGDSVTFEGASPGSRPGFETGHVVAMSSISEGLPFGLIEAMMCGRATVSTDVGGVSDCVDEEQTVGALVPARDPQALADELAHLLTDHEARHTMGRRAAVWARERFDLRGCLEAYHEEYLHAAGTRTR